MFTSLYPGFYLHVRNTLYEFINFLSWSGFFSLPIVEFLLHVVTHSDTHTTFGRTPLDDGSAGRRDLYLRTHICRKRPCLPRDSNPQSQQAIGHRPKPYTSLPPGKLNL